jgi:hypothetical protein
MWRIEKAQLRSVQQGNLYALATESNLYDRIVTAQRNDEDIQIIKQKLAKGDPKYTCFQKDHQDVIWFRKRLVDTTGQTGAQHVNRANMLHTRA